MDLQQISDRLEIEDVLVRYTRGIDTGEWDLLDTVFTPYAEIDYTESGGIADTYPAVKAWLAEVLPAFFPQRMHSLAQVAITFPGGRVGGDEALATAYFHNPMPLAAPDGEGGRGETRVVEFGGLYHHSLVRTPDGWRSRKLHEEIVWKRGV
ncbi:nuclear transport factor 2 family protein [Nocardioides sp. YIM 152315]|uniref:nuclear transport factor 2 family protein n=1 Tax=Nocardioides sp. YIM 152315 TaxID=3031760 RepID=UPI0023DC032B|nr:nuclear transport factor 2 family protein [Nocardioides sp. YIM 152315]MDF1605147.1 nuclear transport factor 2 family protein [Nocardioides sp. YIM 152315]